ncbi:hypothetical protein LSCM1_01503 [Leishmania martiniquensis]|uniref:Uncharacterized protein n=1 Tax=Leishmania martiniquensis TaxID=1580590 RepID=A0A836H5P2_9TRYP|nr:hypothetical protein LSCM1_01503 [Leishmania martiniquensis]
MAAASALDVLTVEAGAGKPNEMYSLFVSVPADCAVEVAHAGAVAASAASLMRYWSAPCIAQEAGSRDGIRIGQSPGAAILGVSPMGSQIRGDAL